jgi:hypothetical protein
MSTRGPLTLIEKGFLFGCHRRIGPKQRGESGHTVEALSPKGTLRGSPSPPYRLRFYLNSVQFTVQKWKRMLY